MQVTIIFMIICIADKTVVTSMFTSILTREPAQKKKVRMLFFILTLSLVNNRYTTFFFFFFAATETYFLLFHLSIVFFL